MGANNTILSRIFTRNTFNEWVSSEETPVIIQGVQKYLSNPNLKNRNVISELYDIMQKSYRNEYIYKNTLLNKILLGRHSINTSTALTEVPIEKSKADFIVINGKAMVYEIKTELDNLDRLEGQLSDYYKAFDNVCVVTSDSYYNDVLDLLKDTSVGICTLTSRKTISTKKEPEPNKSLLNHISMFKILRKNEYEQVLLKYYGDLPKTTQVKYYKECLKLFCEIELDIAYKYMLTELKKRSKLFQHEFHSVPYEIKWLVYFSEYKPHDYAELEKFLNKDFRG
ncbi:sce7726 family protein [Paenibacillus sp. GXUN7292]|uniref:sce7726 family protein n=1 Tax=Paenibacillus sp. GXUN7292 TaxID=3422499 RepID=UPI003D7C6A0E